MLQDEIFVSVEPVNITIRDNAYKHNAL